MAKKQYTDAEKIAWLQAKLAAKGGSKKSSSKGKPKGERKKRSGCTYEESYKAGPDSKHGKEGETIERPKIWGWRKSKQHGFQSFTAYLGPNNGAPKNGTSPDECLVFVVNLETEGAAPATLTGVWSKKYRKLSMTSASLVANPFANDGGYFGRVGSHYKDKVK